MPTTYEILNTQTMQWTLSPFMTADIGRRKYVVLSCP
jgi:hypothetical protein